MGAVACPKCGSTTAEGAAACTKCGLAVDRMESFAATRDAEIPDVLRTAWEHALAGWDDRARHDEVIRLVTQNDAYAWAAARYRSKSPDPVADEQLARIRKAAEVTMRAMSTRPTGREKTPYGATIALLLVLVIGCVGLIYYTLSRGGPTETTSTEKK